MGKKIFFRLFLCLIVVPKFCKAMFSTAKKNAIYQLITGQK